LAGLIETINGARRLRFCAPQGNHIGSVDPHALKIPARRAECSLAESALSPFQTEPTHRDEFQPIVPTRYPYVSGHEIIGRVSLVGSEVTRHKPGDVVGIGCMVETDGTCRHCRAGNEQFCPNITITIGWSDRHGTAPQTYGGHSQSIVVHEHYALRIPSNLNLSCRATALCRHYQLCAHATSRSAARQ